MSQKYLNELLGKLDNRVVDVTRKVLPVGGLGALDGGVSFDCYVSLPLEDDDAQAQCIFRVMERRKDYKINFFGSVTGHAPINITLQLYGLSYRDGETLVNILDREQEFSFLVDNQAKLCEFVLTSTESLKMQRDDMVVLGIAKTANDAEDGDLVITGQLLVY